MSVFRVNKTKDYTVISNYHLKDKHLSLKAKGLLSLMLALPDNWDYSIQGLVNICKENETSVDNALKELKENGYLVIIKKTPKETASGRYEYIYNIYETPIQEGKKQGVENLGLEILGVENQGQLNTKELNIKNENTKNNNIKESKEKMFFENDDLNKLFNDFLEMRKKIKKPATETAIKLLLDKLNKQENDDIRKKMLEKSIVNCWQGLFELSRDEKDKLEKEKWENLTEEEEQAELDKLMKEIEDL